LGLAQVYGIVQQHGGFIDVFSRPEMGTEFVIYLPILKIGTAELSEANISVSPSGLGETILVVEDQEGIREAVCQVLEKLNYNVSSVQNGAAAQKFLEEIEFNIDLVISDVVMPEMGGMALNRWLLESAPEIMLILMSGYPVGDGTRELLDPGRVRLLHKPMDTITLAVSVDEMLAQRKGKKGN
jgi:DNA-binding NtrC family response regulator